MGALNSRRGRRESTFDLGGSDGGRIGGGGRRILATAGLSYTVNNFRKSL